MEPIQSYKFEFWTGYFQGYLQNLNFLHKLREHKYLKLLLLRHLLPFYQKSSQATYLCSVKLILIQEFHTFLIHIQMDYLWRSHQQEAMFMTRQANQYDWLQFHSSLLQNWFLFSWYMCQVGRTFQVLILNNQQVHLNSCGIEPSLIKTFDQERLACLTRTLDQHLRMGKF